MSIFFPQILGLHYNLKVIVPLLSYIPKAVINSFSILHKVTLKRIAGLLIRWNCFKVTLIIMAPIT
jgi:hypothetical protein